MRKDYLICVDSDGCAIDSMDIKHVRCFGPCLIKEWDLGEWELPILKAWNDMNLYSITRGINRFQGLANMLRIVHEDYCTIDGIEEFVLWVHASPELSNEALEKEKGHIFRKALSWSKAVNRAVDAIPMSKKRPFEGVKEALQDAHSFAEVVIISSANRKAVMEEWEYHKMLLCVDKVMTQEDGSKADCIAGLLREGYDADKVLMVGDSKGDYDAAKRNGIFFYPILVCKEKRCWREFCNNALDNLRNGEYGGAYQEKKVQEFFENLR